jgi:replication factor A2
MNNFQQIQSRDRQSLISLTVKQVLNSKGPDEVFKVDDVELNTVKLVGALLDPHDHSTNFTFKLDDGSGIIECKQWIDKDSGAPSSLTNVPPGAFVKVFGNIREYEGKIHILVFNAQVVHDWNEVSYHMLDTILTHLQNTRGPMQVWPLIVFFFRRVLNFFKFVE